MFAGTAPATSKPLDGRADTAGNCYECPPLLDDAYTGTICGA